MNPRSRPRVGPSRARWIARLREGGHRLVSWGPILGQSPQQCKSLHTTARTSPVRPLGPGEFGSSEWEPSKLLCDRSLSVIFQDRRGGFSLCRRHVIQNALAGIANDDLLVGADVVVYLGAKHDLAGGALVVASFGQRRPAQFQNPVVMAQQVASNGAAQLVALAVQGGELSFVLRCPSARPIARRHCWRPAAPLRPG